MEKRYLGDGVYVEIERGLLKLTTHNGVGNTNAIYLEPEVFDALCEFVDDARTAVKAAAQGRK